MVTALPEELLDIIIRYATAFPGSSSIVDGATETVRDPFKPSDPGDLTRLRRTKWSFILVNRTWHRVALPYLYQDIYLGQGGRPHNQDTIHRLLCLLHKLSVDSSVAAKVRTFVLHPSSMDDDTRSTVETCLCAVAGLVPFQRFSLTADFAADSSNSHSWFSSLCSKSAATLTHLEIALDRRCVSAATVRCLCRCENLVWLRLVNMKVVRTAEQANPQGLPVLSLPRLRELQLIATGKSRGISISLGRRANLPSLRRLRIQSGAPQDFLGDFLRRFGSTLRELHLQIVQLSALAHIDILAPDLTHLTCLGAREHRSHDVAISHPTLQQLVFSFDKCFYETLVRLERELLPHLQSLLLFDVSWMDVYENMSAGQLDTLTMAEKLEVLRIGRELTDRGLTIVDRNGMSFALWFNMYALHHNAGPRSRSSGPLKLIT